MLGNVTGFRLLKDCTMVENCGKESIKLMRAINLFTYTRIQQDYSTEYSNILSQREKREKVKEHEFDALRKFVELLRNKNVEIEVFEGFFYSFKIEQIGKEFDLLKIDKGNLVLNIELKSEQIEEEKIKKQLKQNKYYLNYLANDIKLFTFVGETQEVYQYVDGSIIKSSIDILLNVMRLFVAYESEGVETLFKANQYLISPINTPEVFLQGQYFLTKQQENIKQNILDIVYKDNEATFFLGITGKAGTGKTLLLYDIARTVAESNNRCCVVHSGILSEGHCYLNNHWSDVSVIAAKDLKGDGSNILLNYDFILVDESQRIYVSAVDAIKKIALENGKVVIFSYDFGQALSHAEEKRDIPSILRQIEGFQEFSLSEKIRTSKEIASFYKTLLDLNDRARAYMNYSNIEILYANHVGEALELIDLYEKKYGYVFIAYTQSVYIRSVIDIYPNKHDTHHVIGQEYDKVMIIVDENFRYDESGKIQGKKHPNPDYRFYKLLYQGVSRAREKLCILVVNNYKMFKQISDIKYHMLENYQYNDNTNSVISAKTLNKMDKVIKDTITGLKTYDAETISDAVNMIKEELLERKPRRNVIRSGIKLLNIVAIKNADDESIAQCVQQFIDYVSQYA